MEALVKHQVTLTAPEARLLDDIAKEAGTSTAELLAIYVKSLVLGKRVQAEGEEAGLSDEEQAARWVKGFLAQAPDLPNARAMHILAQAWASVARELEQSEIRHRTAEEMRALQAQIRERTGAIKDIASLIDEGRGDI